MITILNQPDITRTLYGLLLMLIISGCSSVPKLDQHPAPPASFALKQVTEAFLGQLAESLEDRNEDKSGVLLLDKGEEALLWRGALVDQAEKSIDIQTFIWANDNVGTIAAERILRAAKRGVRVRVLVDDFMLSADKQHLLWLDAHSNVEIRIYNPLAAPNSSIMSKVLSMFSNWAKSHRRMHNKLFVVDNSFAIAGGRNIADDYFDMSEHSNYRDRDVLVTGRVIPALSGSFDTYWNSRWAVPLQQLAADPTSAADRKAYYLGLQAYAKDPKNYPPRFKAGVEATTLQLGNIEGLLTWGRVEMFADMPGKNTRLDEMAGYGVTGRILTETAANTREEILAETPYFIPMMGTMQLFDDLKRRGVKVSILTNSINSTDNYPAFAGYVKKRKMILDAGVNLYELRADPESIKSLIDRYELISDDAIMGLHAKTAVFDRKRVFIGSFNLDPRSTHLNTELGLLIHSKPFAKQVADSILDDMTQKNSWHVTHEPTQGITWRTNRAGELIETEREPEVSFSTYLKMFFIFIMPIENIL